MLNSKSEVDHCYRTKEKASSVKSTGPSAIPYKNNFKSRALFDHAHFAFSNLLDGNAEKSS